MTLGFGLLALAVLVGLVLVPLGLPGLWLMLAAGLTHRMVAPGSRIGWTTLAIVTALAIVAEYLEFWLAARYTAKYGGSRRASWGALLGGFLGAIVGVPVPIIGSVIGAFAGSFLGALLAEYSVTRDPKAAHRAAFGSLVGRVAATVVKTGTGLAIGAILLIRGFGTAP
jgi:uncharacterized protein YqgC (DUF456 family)